MKICRLMLVLKRGSEEGVTPSGVKFFEGQDILPCIRAIVFLIFWGRKFCRRAPLLPPLALGYWLGSTQLKKIAMHHVMLVSNLSEQIITKDSASVLLKTQRERRLITVTTTFFLKKKLKILMPTANYKLMWLSVIFRSVFNLFNENLRLTWLL